MTPRSLRRPLAVAGLAVAGLAVALIAVDRTLMGTPALAGDAATGSATDAAPPAVGDVAGDFELDALSGGRVRLSEVAADGPVVLVVLRGFPGYQCPICTEQVGEFIARADALKAAGAQVLLVYPGPADDLKAQAAEFVRGRDYPEHFRLLLDPDYDFTNAYDLRWDAAGETAYPSTFVLEPKTRRIAFAKVSRTHGDRASAEQALAALRQAAATDPVP